MKIRSVFLLLILSMQSLAIFGRIQILTDLTLFLQTARYWSKGITSLAKNYNFTFSSDLRNKPLGALMQENLGLAPEQIMPFICALDQAVYTKKFYTENSMLRHLPATLALLNQYADITLLSFDACALQDMLETYNMDSLVYRIVPTPIPTLAYYENNFLVLEAFLDTIVNVAKSTPDCVFITEFLDLAVKTNEKGIHTFFAPWGWHTTAARDAYAPHIPIIRNINVLLDLLATS